MVGDIYVVSSGPFGLKKVLNHLYDPVLNSVQVSESLNIAETNYDQDGFDL